MKKILIIFALCFFIIEDIDAKSYRIGDKISGQIEFYRSYKFQLPPGEWVVADRYGYEYYGFKSKGYKLLKIRNKKAIEGISIGELIIPAKWVGNKRTNLDGSRDGEAMDIVIDGNNYYISGWTGKRNETHDYPSVWKNNQNSRRTLKEGTLRRSEVSSNDREAGATAITVKNGKIYATGYTYFDYSVTSASFWTIDYSGNNPSNEITEFNGGEMKDIVISENGDIITVGDGEVWINGISGQAVEVDVSAYTNAVTISE